MVTFSFTPIAKEKNLNNVTDFTKEEKKLQNGYVCQKRENVKFAISPSAVVLEPFTQKQ